MFDKRFNPNTEFCSKCLKHDYWWTGGGSWSPDRCPEHSLDDGDVVLWKNMSILQKHRAAKLMDQMWFDKYGCHYFKEKA